ETVQQWRIRGGAFAAEGKIDEALHCRRQALELEPANEQLRLELLRELVLAGRFDEAKSTDGGLLQLWRILGGGFPAEGRPELGLFCRRRAVELAPNDPQLRLELVSDATLAGVEHIRTLDSPAEVAPLCMLARIHAVAGKLELALECARWASKLDKDSHVAQQELVRLLIANRRTDEAFELSAAIDPAKIQQESYGRLRYKDF